uniref:Uncharacterized protein n=1 Tax=Panagrolaimus sp. JU765 TaxID=591449 RepID=A0AC34QVN2_9BILA
MNVKDVQWLLNAIICCAIPSILGFIRTNQCYSCMSPEYETLFREGHFAKYFYEPKNFSAQCNHPMNPHNMGSVACRTICLTLIQDLIVMGRATGKRLTMRGCSTTLNRFGFVNRTMQIFDRYDMCREVKMSDLFNYDTDSQVISYKMFGKPIGKKLEVLVTRTLSVGNQNWHSYFKETRKCPPLQSGLNRSIENHKLAEKGDLKMENAWM